MKLIWLFCLKYFAIKKFMDINKFYNRDLESASIQPIKGLQARKKGDAKRPVIG